MQVVNCIYTMTIVYLSAGPATHQWSVCGTPRWTQPHFATGGTFGRISRKYISYINLPYLSPCTVPSLCVYFKCDMHVLGNLWEIIYNAHSSVIYVEGYM